MCIWTRKSASIQPRTSLRPRTERVMLFRPSSSSPMMCKVEGPELLLGGREEQRRVPLAIQPGPITLSEARSRLDRSRFSRPNTHFSAFFKIYNKIIFSRANSAKFCQKFRNFCENFDFFFWFLRQFLQKFDFGMWKSQLFVPKSSVILQNLNL